MSPRVWCAIFGLVVAGCACNPPVEQTGNATTKRTMLVLDLSGSAAKQGLLSWNTWVGPLLQDTTSRWQEGERLSVMGYAATVETWVDKELLPEVKDRLNIGKRVRDLLKSRREFWSNLAGGDLKNLDIREVPSKRKGTRADLMLEEVLRFVNDDSAKCRIIIVTDGGFDDSRMESIAKSASSLKLSRNVESIEVHGLCQKAVLLGGRSRSLSEIWLNDILQRNSVSKIGRTSD